MPLLAESLRRRTASIIADPLQLRDPIDDKKRSQSIRRGTFEVAASLDSIAVAIIVLNTMTMKGTVPMETPRRTTKASSQKLDIVRSKEGIASVRLRVFATKAGWVARLWCSWEVDEQWVGGIQKSRLRWTRRPLEGGRLFLVGPLGRRTGQRHWVPSRVPGMPEASDENLLADVI